MAEIDWEQTLFNLILRAGNARCRAKEAAEHAEAGEWEEARIAMEDANTEQGIAHGINADIVRMEASGTPVPFAVLLVHAMDLLLLAWSEIDYTEQHIKMCQRVQALEAEVMQWRNGALKS